jgi:uncharacterized membrane protein YoaK (UPF0700 family)
VRAAERDSLLFLLAITSGSADSWAFLGMRHAFVANMTGNTILLGLGIFTERGDVIYHMIALIFYAVGVAVGAFLTRGVKPGSIWSKSVSGALFLEALLLLSAEAGWITSNTTPAPKTLCVLLICLALGVGLQSGSLLSLKLPGIITTYISGTWTTLISGLVLVNYSEERVPRNTRDFEQRLMLQTGFLTVYFASAVMGGWLYRYMPALVGGISSIPVLLVAAYGILRG